MKITDAIISAIIKKGVLYEARNVEVDIPITSDAPMDGADIYTKHGKVFIGVIKVKCDHMSLKFEKEEK